MTRPRIHLPRAYATIKPHCWHNTPSSGLGFDLVDICVWEVSVANGTNTSAVTTANGWRVLGDPANTSVCIEWFSGDTVYYQVRYVTDTRFRGITSDCPPSGSSAIANGQSGVRISDQSQGIIVAGQPPALRNVISGNTAEGVLINGSRTTNNTVQGNYIGTDFSGNSAVGNLGFGGGVYIASGATNNMIGGTATVLVMLSAAIAAPMATELRSN